jgi:hypothetical protein
VNFIVTIETWDTTSHCQTRVEQNSVCSGVLFQYSCFFLYLVRFLLAVFSKAPKRYNFFAGERTSGGDAVGNRRVMQPPARRSTRPPHHDCLASPLANRLKVQSAAAVVDLVRRLRFDPPARGWASERCASVDALKLRQPRGGAGEHGGRSRSGPTGDVLGEG